MTDAGRKLLELALLLAPKERAEIAARLVESINDIAAAEAAWMVAVDRRARLALADELCPVYYLGRAPVPLCFDRDAELDLERAVGRIGDPRRVDDLLAELTDAIRRVAESPCRFGLHPALPEELGVRRLQLADRAVLFVPLAKEVRIVAITEKFHPPIDDEISLEALVTVEDWLAKTGLRVATFLAMMVH